MLIERVRWAAALRPTTPENVEKFVGTRADFNSSRKRPETGSRIGLPYFDVAYATLAFDEVDRETLLSLLHDKVDAVIWNCRQTSRGSPAVVGIAWLRDGTVKVFRGRHTY